MHSKIHGHDTGPTPYKNHCISCSFILSSIQIKNNDVIREYKYVYAYVTLQLSKVYIKLNTPF